MRRHPVYKAIDKVIPYLDERKHILLLEDALKIILKELVRLKKLEKKVALEQD